MIACFYPSTHRVIIVLLVVLPSALWADDVRWLDLPQIQFVTPEAFPLAVDAPPTMPPAPPPPPLFPAATVARDADPLLVQVAEQPTLEGARAWLDWKLKRLAHVRQLDAFLRQALQERKGQP